MRQVVGRTLRRKITRKQLWNGIHEPLTNFYRWDPEKNIIRWAWTRFDGTRANYQGIVTVGTWDHLKVHRLRRHSDVAKLLTQFVAGTNQNYS